MPQAATTVEPMIATAKTELERMIDLIPEGMLLADGDGIVQRANLGLLRLLGAASFPSVLKQSCTVLFPVATAGGGSTLTDIFHAKSPPAGDLWQFEADAQLPQRGLRSLAFTIIPAGSVPRWFMVAVKDITDEKVAQQASEKKRQIQTTETIVGGLAHAVNQPLTVIMSSAHLILQSVQTQSADPAQVAELAGRIMDRVNYIAEQLNRAQALTDFVVEPYDQTTHILDLR